MKRLICSLFKIGGLSANPPARYIEEPYYPLTLLRITLFSAIFTGLTLTQCVAQGIGYWYVTNTSACNLLNGNFQFYRNGNFVNSFSVTCPGYGTFLVFSAGSCGSCPTEKDTFYMNGVLIGTYNVYPIPNNVSYYMPITGSDCDSVTSSDDISDGVPTQNKPPNDDCGMASWQVSEPYISLWLSDEPLGYQPALGPRISFELSFKQREFSSGFDTNTFNVGKRWNCAWLSYVSQDTNQNSVVLFAGGGQRTFVGTNDYLTNTRLTGTTNTGFTVSYPDGTQDIFGFIVTNASGVFQKAFLTERWNAQAQKTRLNYATYNPSAPVVRLLSVVDGDGRANLIYYNNANSYSTNLISQVVDPFNRTNTLAYDSNGHLINITDVIGIFSSFAYDTNDWVTNLGTPYGNTGFAITDSGTNPPPNGRSILITQPDGSHELYLYEDAAPGVAISYSQPNISPFSSTMENVQMNFRNSFHWGTLQYPALSTTTISGFTTNDILKARMRHWLKSTGSAVSQTLSLEQDPCPDSAGQNPGQQTWYDYAGKTNNSYIGTQSQSLFIARVLPDGTTRYVRTDRNNLGLPIQIIDTYGNGTTYRTNTLTYAANNIDLLTITNPLSVQVTSNAYNSYHEVTTNFNALGERTVLTYNANQQVTSVTRPIGLITTNIYFTSGSSSNQLSQAIDYAFLGGSQVNYRTNSFTWTNDLVLTYTDPRNLTLTYTWDNLQRVRRIDFPDPGFITNTYVNLDLTKVVDRLGFSTSFGYDAVRHLVAATNANGAVTRYGYCSCGSLQSITNAYGTSLQQVTSYSYDLQGNRLQTVGSDNYTVNFNYSLLSQVTNSYDALSSVTNWYNNQGLLVASSNTFGQVNATVYDILDRATNSVDVNGVTITSTFDNLHRRLTHGYPDGGVERFGYTANFPGLTSYTNQLINNVVNYSYDPAGRKTNEVYPGITTNKFAYFGANDLETLTDGKGQVTTWNYDIYGRNTNKLDATSMEILRFQYDPNNRLTNRWSKQKGNTVYSYDPIGNRTGITYPLSPSITYQYDLLNRLTNMADTVGTTLFTYTSGNQLQSEAGPWTDDGVSYIYNNHLRGSLSLLQPNSSAWTEIYAYDAARRLTNVTSGAGAFGYTYDALRQAQVANLALPNGAFITNTFDSVARLLSTTLKNSSSSILNAHQYAYNSASQRTWATNTAGDYRGYTYDLIGQLRTAYGTDPTAATNRWQEQLGLLYDAAGNLFWRTNNSLIQSFSVNNLNELTTTTNSGTLTVAGTTTSPATNVTVWGTGLSSGGASIYGDSTWARPGGTLPNGTATYNASAKDTLGRTDTNTVTINLPTISGYLYDLNGNLTNDGVRIFTYDDENQLISVVVSNGVTTSTRSDFTYDGTMRRRIRVESTWGGSSWLTNQVTRYVYDGNLVIQERSGNNLPTVIYTCGRDLSGSLQGAGGAGGLLARTDAGQLIGGSPSAHAYYHADANGNITALINATQLIVAKYLYDPFGNILSKSGSLADVNLYRFSSKEYHLNSGVIYYLYRFYDPAQQRWLNRDPIAERGGENLYAFVGNNPATYIDPDGREVITTVVVATTLTASSGGGAGATVTFFAGGATVVGGSAVLPVVAGAVALPLAGVTLFAMANTPPPLVYYPAGGNPIPTSVSMPIGVIVGPGEYWDPNTKTIRDTATGTVLRDEFGRPVASTEKLPCPKKNVNWKSVKQFGHTFSEHGEQRDPTSLADRARITGVPQGQWLDNEKAAQFLSDLPALDGPASVFIPEGLGRVVLPDGSILNTTRATVIPNPNGGIRTAFPIK